MTVFTTPREFEALLLETSEKRTQVRHLAGRGCGTQGEQDPIRREAYLTNKQASARAGAESLVGNTVDYQTSAFLAKGALARRAVAYIELNLPNQSRMATGFLISPDLLMTNCHVIEDADQALSATVFFDRELDITRVPLQSTAFSLAPQRFFLSSPVDKLDYTIVALGNPLSGSALPTELGFCALSPAGNKHVIGMNVNVIQHPNGYYKQLAIRNNLLTYRTDNALLYETDTEVGSSGAPVFNDSWDVIALHHWGQPYLAKADLAEAPDIPTHANEGVRISVIYQALQQALAGLTGAPKNLLLAALEAYKSTATNGAPTGAQRGVLMPPRPQLSESESFVQAVTGRESAMPTLQSPGEVTFSVPLEITVRLGPQPVRLPGSIDVTSPPVTTARLSRGAEAARVDVDYASRKGYAVDFIPGFKVPMPTLKPAVAKQVAPLRAGESDAADGLLNYEHFSLKMHKTRRVAIFTATNIDGDTYQVVNRKTGEITPADSEGDTWYKDPRISESFYLGQDFYSSTSNYFDRGHLTRRTDPTWGPPEDALRANTDTFHFTNCSPQHFRFNESAKYWQGVERYVLETGVLKAGTDARLCVLQGPIYNSAIDLWIDNEVQIPSSFWKIVVWKGAQGLKAVGMVVDQLPLLSEARVNMGQPKEVSHVDVSQWRMHIQDIGAQTGLVFDPAIIQADTVGQPQPQPGAESASGMRIASFTDIKL